MEVSGEVADLVVKESIEAAAELTKLAGSGIKNVTALLAAAAREDYKTAGKASIKRLAKDPAPPTVTPLKKKDLKRFQALAKSYGLLYCIPKKRGENTDILNVVSTETYAAKLNAIYQAMGYDLPNKEGAPAKKAKARAPRENSSTGRGSGSTPSRTRGATEPQERKPSVKKKLAALEAMARQSADAPERVKQRER